MKKITFTVALLLTVALLMAQAPDTLWTKTYGGLNYDICNDMQLTSDGGYILAGVTLSYGAGSNDFYLVKTDANGDTLWTRTYGSSITETAYSVFQTSDGGYVVAGKVLSSGPGSSEVFIVKTDSLGDTLWTRTVGGFELDEANSVIQTDGDDYYIILGSTKSYGPGSASVYFIEISPAADTIWEDYFGGPGNDYGYEVIETNNGYVFIAKSASFGAGSYDAWIVRTDWDYNIIWTTTIGGITGDEGYTLQQTANGGFIGGGRTSSFGPGNESFLIFHLNSSGDSLWAKAYGGTDRDECHSIQQTADGGYIAAGVTKSFGAGNYDFYIVRTDANGDSLWTKTLGGTGDDECRAIKQTPDGGYIIAGSTESFGMGQTDFWLIKLAPDPANINEIKTRQNFSLHQNYPNPFKGKTHIKFELQKPAFASLNVFNVLGEKLCTLVEKSCITGPYELEFNAGKMPPGIYYYTLSVNGIKQTKKMVVQ
ncbi:T9SS type A sorting domain-containing protein [Bacteroidota bacterium]